MKFHIKMGHDVTMLTSKKCYSGGKLTEDDKAEFYDSNGARIIRLEYKNKGFGKLPAYKGFYSMLCDIKPDIIFSHGCQYVDFANVGKYVKRNPECVLFCDNHADLNNSAQNRLSKTILHGLIWKYRAMRVDPYVLKWYGTLPSRVDFLTDMYGISPDKVSFLPMGYDDEIAEEFCADELIDELKNNIGISKNDFVIVSGGKFDRAKSQILNLISAVDSMNDPHIKLVLFGSVSDGFRKKFEAACSSDVIFMGWANEAQAYQYFSMADLVAFPSSHSVYWEQAAGLGRPLLLNKWPGTEYIDLNGNAVYVDGNSVDELRAAISDIAKNNDRYDEMLKNAVQCKSFFSYRDIARRCLLTDEQ